METNYELKHKCLLVPLRAVLLVLAMLLVGFTTYAQSGKSVRVANNEQLIEAMQNPSVGTVVLEAGYYPYLDYQAAEGAKVSIKDSGNGNRDDCTYFIIDNDVCFDQEPGQFVSSFAQAGTLPNPSCPADNTGVWTVSIQPPGSTVNFLVPANMYDMPFEVDQPGSYSLRYTWVAFSTFVETEYFFFGPEIVTLSAPDICGLTTTVTFSRESALPDPQTMVSWTLNGLPYAGPTTSGQFELTVPECGYYELCVTVDPSLCPPMTECIWIDFSCMPYADAGPDINVCDELCVSLVGSTGLTTYSPSYAFSWYQTAGPGTLTFNPDAEQLSVQACIDENPPCEYGEYTVEFQVQNGECYDEDEAIIRYYQSPVAEAGVVDPLCDDFTFNLGATPFVYCGIEGTNYWSTAYWELVSSPAGAVVAFTDVNDPNTGISITGALDVCLYGDYTFRWVEINSKTGVYDTDGCYAEDLVTVSIIETPVPDAGEELVLCNTFEFDLFGYGDEPCNPDTEVTYSWEKTAEPGNCNVVITSGTSLYPHISISGCDDACEYGKYTFELTQSNDGECEGTDAVDVWILEMAAADAGPDQHLCYSFGFDLTAVPTNFCGVAGTNYFTWGEWTLVSGPTTDVTIANIGGPATGVTINDVNGCTPYGMYTFRWTEYNGFGTGMDFEGCEDFDDVNIYIYEQPEVLAGLDQEYCDVQSFYLDGTIDELCQDGSYQILWTLVSQPGLCDVSFMYNDMIDPMVSIANCGTSCQYGEYKFLVTQTNGYYDDGGVFIPICTDTDEVSVWNYEPPTDVDAGPDQELCDVFTFDLTAVGSDYCSVETNWYSWALVSQPLDAGCDVSFTNQFGLTTGVVIDNCDDICNYGEFVFRFTEYNGSTDVYCSDWDEVSVFIFEMPVADAGLDVNECVDIDLAPYCYDMAATLDYCYSMNGLWTKTCGPGDVVFTDVNDPAAEACFDEPGRYKFTWSVWNGAENCMAEEEVIFDLLEQPVASADFTSITPECNTLCVDLGLAGVNKYEYFGTDLGECPNYLDFATWTVLPGAPGIVTFDPDVFAPDADICVDTYGGYTLRWTEINKNVDGDFTCEDYVEIYVEFNETPEPIAVGGEICSNCFTLSGTLDGGFDPIFYWEVLPGGNCVVTIDNELNAEVCIEDLSDCYGTYGFVLHQFNGECEGTDTAYVTFYQLPTPVAICYSNYPNDCGPEYGYETEFNYYGCLEPNEVLEVCADGWSYFNLDCYNCLPGFDWYDPAFYGWTFEWSVIGPSGTDVWSEPGYYDFENGYWNYPWLDINWGECCDTARIYLTITTDDDCELTLEYKAYVYHKPCVDIVGPDVAEVDMTTEYCNNCPPNPCLLYTWTAEHCGIITDGQGTECIDVLWTDYNVNGGWGEITLTVFDTCTGCCNYDAMPVKIWPAGTLGDATLSGYVYYHNESETPLNGVEIQLWNGAIPVMSTTSSNDVEGGGMGYYEFTGLNAATEFGVTATYDAPWYGANATDALAVELRAIEWDPMPILVDAVVEDAMNVNNSLTPFISAVDALWVKQRAVNMVNYFPAGNWAFDPAMSTQAVVGYDIYALTMGDANRSNIPASMKSMPAIDLVNDGIMNVVAGEVFTLPIRIAKANEFGAIQLDLEYNPSLVEVVEVVPVEGMISNITDGNVYIAFSNLNTMILSDNDVVVTLKVKAIGEIAIPESMFSIGINSEFADASARTIEPVILKSFGITTGPAALDYFLSSNRPNPFSTSTFIEYTMPETGKVKLSVLDMLGQEIAVLVESTQTAGAYTVEFSAAGLATGVYLYKITVDGETRDFISTQRMVVSH